MGDKERAAGNIGPAAQNQPGQPDMSSALVVLVTWLPPAGAPARYLLLHRQLAQSLKGNTCHLAVTGGQELAAAYPVLLPLGLSQATKTLLAEAEAASHSPGGALPHAHTLAVVLNDLLQGHRFLATWAFLWQPTTWQVSSGRASERKSEEGHPVSLDLNLEEKSITFIHFCWLEKSH